MKKTNHIIRTASALAFLTAAACGSDSGNTDAAKQIDAPKTIDAPKAIDAPGSGSAIAFHQVEELARPGVNEALLISNDFMNGFNAAAPSFAGVDPTTLSAVVNEAKTVLKAIYFGVCLTDGLAAGGVLTASTGLKPGGIQCPEIGLAVLGGSGGTVATDVGSAASTYADTVFGQFIPDVMRIDTSVTVSTYFSPSSLCGGSAGPLLCGGRGLTDDVIDVTYDYLLAGAAVPLTAGSGSGLDAVFQHLVSDGVGYSTSVNNLTALAVDPTNSQQGHNPVSATFPYSPAPY
jgi:hypothetical protein